MALSEIQEDFVKEIATRAANLPEDVDLKALGTALHPVFGLGLNGHAWEEWKKLKEVTDRGQRTNLTRTINAIYRANENIHTLQDLREANLGNLARARSISQSGTDGLIVAILKALHTRPQQSSQD